MPDAQLLDAIAEKDADHAAIAEDVAQSPALVATLLDGLSADTARVKYGCDKVLRTISARWPNLLYPRIDFFIQQLGSDKNVLKWGAIHILADLAAVDTDGTFEKIFDEFFAPIPGPELIPAGNVIAAAAKIAAAKPELADRITTEILKVQTAKYKTAECRNIAIGKAIEAFGEFFDRIKDKEPVIKFVKSQLENSRAATAKKAERFVKMWC